MLLVEEELMKLLEVSEQLFVDFSLFFAFCRAVSFGFMSCDAVGVIRIVCEICGLSIPIVFVIAIPNSAKRAKVNYSKNTELWCMMFRFGILLKQRSKERSIKDSSIKSQIMIPSHHLSAQCPHCPKPPPSFSYANTL